MRGDRAGSADVGMSGGLRRGPTVRARLFTSSQPWNLHFLPKGRREGAMGMGGGVKRPSPPRVLFKFPSLPGNTSCAPSRPPPPVPFLSTLVAADSAVEEKTCSASISAESRDHALFCRLGTISSERSERIRGRAGEEE